MKYIFTLLTFACFVSSVSSVSAAETPSLSGTTTTQESSVAELNLESITALDDMHIRVTFSEPVEIDTLKLKITQQLDNSTLKFLSLTGVVDDEFSIDINLESELKEGSAYTLTVISAIGLDGALIKDGALALRDFVTPSPLKKYEVQLNAPANPNAVLVKTGTISSATGTAPTITPLPASAPPVVPLKDVKELPLTGMNPLYILAFLLPVVLIWMRRRAQ